MFERGGERRNVSDYVGAKKIKTYPLQPLWRLVAAVGIALASAVGAVAVIVAAVAGWC